MRKKTDIDKVTIKVPVNSNKLLQKALDNVNKNSKVKAFWKVINVNAIDRSGMSDHGHVHFQIVANIALRLARILKKNKIEMSTTRDYGMNYEYAEVVILLASLFHDLGMSIDREGHEEFSLFLADKMLESVLDFLPDEERVIVSSEILHAIIAHRSGGKPKTIEAGIVRVSDALDMSEGRSRISYETGHIDIFSVSAAAINGIKIKEGSKRPVQIEVEMNNSSGIFQIDELLKKKLKGSGIENFVEIKAHIPEGKEKKLIKEFTIRE